MRARNHALTSSVLFIAGVLGCGGATSGTTVSGSSEGGPGDGSAGQSSGSGSGGSTDGGDDASEDGSLLISGGSSSGSSSGSGSGSGDAMSSSGAAPTDGGPDQIQCGAAGACDSTSQVCCAKSTGRSCVAIGTCTGDSLACSGTNSCPAGSGDVCCEALAANGTIRTRCETTCPSGALQLCTTKADCKAGDDCRRRIDGYGTCVAAQPRDGGNGTTDAAAD